MSKTVKIDDLAEEVMKGLTEYSKLATSDMKKAVKKAGNDVRKEIQSTAPKDTGAYAKSWAVKTTRESAERLEVTVHSKNRYKPGKQGLINKLNGFTSQLITLQHNYKFGELGIGKEYMDDYITEYDKLTRGDLIEYEEKLREIQQNCETEFRETFLSKMRENINNADDLFRSLNVYKDSDN